MSLIFSILIYRVLEPSGFLLMTLFFDKFNSVAQSITEGNISPFFTVRYPKTSVIFRLTLYRCFFDLYFVQILRQNDKYWHNCLTRHTQECPLSFLPKWWYKTNKIPNQYHFLLTSDSSVCLLYNKLNSSCCLGTVKCERIFMVWIIINPKCIIFFRSYSPRRQRS